MRIEVTDNGVMRRFSNQLAYLSDREVKQASARALNHEGMKARTQVKRILVRETGIKYGMVEKAMSTYKAHSGKLEFTIQARGSETNLGLFGARQTKQGVSAAPWRKRRIFRSADGERGSFFVPGTKVVYIREGADRYPIKPLFGPNVAREMVKPEPVAELNRANERVGNRLSHEIMRILQRA